MNSEGIILIYQYQSGHGVNLKGGMNPREME